MLESTIGAVSGTSGDDDGADPSAGSGTSAGADEGESDGVADEGDSDGDSDGDGDGDGALDEPCEPLQVPPPVPAEVTTVAVQNVSDQVLYVGFPNECELVPFLVSLDGEAYPHEVDPCSDRCEDVVEGACFGSGCGPCGTYQVVRLEPGARWEYDWNGLVFEAHDVPDGCGSEQCAQCLLPRTADGLIMVGTVATFECTGDACDCEEAACVVQTEGVAEDAPALGAGVPVRSFGGEVVLELG